MSSLSLFYGKRLSLLFCFFDRRVILYLQQKKYHLYRTQRKNHISIYFLRKIIFRFPSVEKISYFWEKERSSVLMIKERSYSSATNLKRPSFQNIWRIYHTFLYFLRKIIFNFLLSFFVIWKYMLSKISGFLFIATVSGSFLLFLYNNQTHRARKVESTRSQNQAL